MHTIFHNKRYVLVIGVALHINSMMFGMNNTARVISGAQHIINIHYSKYANPEKQYDRFFADICNLFNAQKNVRNASAVMLALSYRNNAAMHERAISKSDYGSAVLAENALNEDRQALIERGFANYLLLENQR